MEINALLYLILEFANKPKQIRNLQMKTMMVMKQNRKVVYLSR